MDSIKRFQNLLMNLFQFETSDLDFGIYRILNFKTEQIKKFIYKDILDKVESAFARYKAEKLADVKGKIEEAKQQVIQSLGPEAFTTSGELIEDFRKTPVARRYLSLLERLKEVESIDEIQNQVYNDLYNFFARYYEEGDFIPQYRYSIKTHRYAIPYNGEEVKLYWVNADQYYTKTGLLFRDYTFTVGGYRIVFRTISAKEELGSNKATRERFFILDDEEPLEKTSNRIIVRFQYRELTEQEVELYDVKGGSNVSKQLKINQKIYDEILKMIGEDQNLKKALRKGEGDKQEPFLLKHISRFTAKNTKDYFIHKNLKKFLSEQLDYFIKAEVLNIETIEKEEFLDKHIARAKVVREIGETIIDFLSQIEDFQKKLWEKKKFVLKTDYVITLDKIKEYAGENFLREILDLILRNKEQLKEWEELGFGKIENKNELMLQNTLEGVEYKKLPIDTRYFSVEFKEKLLEKLTEKNDLDDILDGILIKSENWQALNLLLEKYKEKVQTIYIDPPFNKKEEADYLYNVKYKDSTWITMLENRLRLAMDFLKDTGCIFLRCDYNGNMYTRLLMNEIFGEDNFINEIIINRTLAKQVVERQFAQQTDSVFLYSKTNKFTPIPVERPLKEARWYPLVHFPREDKKPRIIFGKEYYPPKGRRWGLSQNRINTFIEKGKCRINENLDYVDCFGNRVKGVPELLYDSELVGNEWLDIPGYAQRHHFPTENSEELLKRIIESSSKEGDLVMDFFLGSGTTTAVAHKLKRKWIGVEMGEHFWTVILPRMKKVLHYDKSGISKEKEVKEKYNKKKAGGFFKYQVLEQYEDSIDNIELLKNKQAQLKFGEDYLIKYFLDYETRESPYLLNIKMLKNPFNYKLKVNLREVGNPQEITIDIPETFNYLLGLKVKKIKVRKNKDKKYLFILGEKDDKNISIVWREYDENWSENDFRKDKEFIAKNLRGWAPHTVYINGQSVLTPNFGDLSVEIRYIEPEFKSKLMV